MYICMYNIVLSSEEDKATAIGNILLLLLLHSFNGLFPGQPGKLAPVKQNHSGKTNLNLLEQEIVSGSGIR